MIVNQNGMWFAIWLQTNNNFFLHHQSDFPAQATSFRGRGKNTPGLTQDPELQYHYSRIPSLGLSVSCYSWSPSSTLAQWSSFSSHCAAVHAHARTPLFQHWNPQHLHQQRDLLNKIKATHKQTKTISTILNGFPISSKPIKCIRAIYQKQLEAGCRVQTWKLLKIEE